MNHQKPPLHSRPKAPSDHIRISKELLELTEGGGETGRRLRSIDWSQSPVGPFESWPQSLKTALSICLATRFPMLVWWGNDLTVFYNDAYIPLAGPEKHPQYLGRPAREQWSEIWGALGPLTEQVFQTGKATWAENMELFMTRKGFLEETYFTFSYSPIRDETGAVRGIINPCQETTERILGERRLKTLHDLGAEEIRGIGDLGPFTAEVLARNPRDVPFVMLYLHSPAGAEAQFELVGSTGIAAGFEAAPYILDPSAPAYRTWMIGEGCERKKAQHISGLRALFSADLPPQPYDEMPDSASIHPLLIAGQAAPAGFLILGISPRLAFDEAYQAFFGLITKHVTTQISSARVIEQEKKRADALAEIARVKTDFFSNVSHEFRTPLTLMLGPLEDLLAAPDTELPSILHAEAEVAHRNALRLLKLVNSLLDFSRIESGRASVMFQPVDLAQSTTELAGVFRSAIEKAGLRLIVDCPAMEAPVYVDRDMWEKIVLNLISNAFKFTFSGEIRVQLRAVGNMAELSVNDTGSGIPADELPHLFERFHRVRGTRARTHEGTGIGLALVDELVKLHGGAVRVESRMEAGSTFFVDIPLGRSHLPANRIMPPEHSTATVPDAQAYVDESLYWLSPGVESDPKPADEPAAGSRECILLADDNLDMRAYIRRLLEPCYEVLEVRDGQAAFETAVQRLPDAVLTDVMMPRLNGFELLARLRAEPRTQSIPVIMLSGRAGEEARVEGLDTGADDYLVKPFSARELLARIRANLTLAKARQASARNAAELEAATEREHLREDQLRMEQSLRAEAEVANRLKDEFIATVSHELRTPLTAMHGWTQLLLRGNTDDATTSRGLQTIHRNVRLQILLIEDLLDLSRILTGRLKLDVQRVDLPLVIADLINSIQLAADAKQITLTTDLDENAGPVLGDSERLRQIVLNLLNNAVKFTQRGGRVHIHLVRLDSHIELSVSDTGQGIAADFLPHIFERFRQQDSSATREHGGLGLGLAIVKSLVELHGGTVEAESRGAGQGSTFTLRIPLLRSHTEPADSNEQTPQGPYLERLDGLRVLVVEDDPDTLALLTTILENCRANVSACSRGDQALDAIREKRPDVLICDIGLPGKDGYTLMRELRRTKSPESQTRALAITAYTRSADREKAMEAGFNAYLAKPIDPAALVHAVAELARMDRTLTIPAAKAQYRL